jgi:hypothetical protein
MNNRKDKVIDDPKVPAGFFPLYKPKPPFMEFPNGHGFKGVLLEEQATGKLQCHYCGKTFNTLTPHLLKHHKMLPRTYKFEVGLNAHVPLMSSELIRVQRANFTNKTAEEQKKLRIGCASYLRIALKKLEVLRGSRKPGFPCRSRMVWGRVSFRPNTISFRFIGR